MSRLYFTSLDLILKDNLQSEEFFKEFASLLEKFAVEDSWKYSVNVLNNQ